MSSYPCPLFEEIKANVPDLLKFYGETCLLDAHFFMPGQKPGRAPELVVPSVEYSVKHLIGWLTVV